MKKSAFFVAIDLYGEVMHSTELSLPYEHTRRYYKALGGKVNEFIQEFQIQPASILGVSIAIQGIVSSDGHSVSYGVIMGNSEMKLDDFTEFIPYPCRLEHDCKAAAFLELWRNKEIDSATVLLLNHNFGGSIIIHRQIFNGTHFHGGLIEHLCISKDGPVCYCGNRGCLETYCSANVIETSSGMDINSFFYNLRKNENKCIQIWTGFLDKLAFAMRNLNNLIDGHIIISGYLAPFFIEDDINYLLHETNLPPFSIDRNQILVGTYGQYTIAVGTALYYVNNFLLSV